MLRRPNYLQQSNLSYFTSGLLRIGWTQWVNLPKPPKAQVVGSGCIVGEIE